MVSTRQIDIIAFLISKKDWITSEQLSQFFNIGKKTIQKEIKMITDDFGSECLIRVNQHQGYHLEYISEDLKRFIREEVSRYGGKNSLRIRPSSFVLYLLFQSNYVTMQQLADTFYMSKTAVSIEMETIKRWIDRYDGIDLEVSNTKGIKIHASEIRKRIYSAKFGFVYAFLNVPLSEDIAQQYAGYLTEVKIMMEELFAEHQYIVTGEECSKNIRFIAFTIFRAKLGYIRSGEALYEDNRPIILLINKYVKNKFDYELKDIELFDIQNMLDESSLIYTNNDVYPEINAAVDEFEEKIQSILKMKGQPLFSDRKMITQYLKKCYKRAEAGNVAINHYNEDIIKRYPLEAHLTYRFFPYAFNLKITKEMSFIALFLANSTLCVKHNLSILLVSDQNMSINSQIETLFRLRIFTGISEFRVIPTYLFERDMEIGLQYDILITTSQEVVFLDKTFYHIRCILSDDEIESLRLLCKDVNRKKKKQIKQRIIEKYYCEINYGKEDVMPSVHQIIGCVPDSTLSYHTIGNDTIYIGRIDPSIETKIVTYKLKTPIQFLNKHIKKIIYVQYKEGTDGIQDFFEVVADIISGM